ncbi:ABC transporter permease [Trujillonella endophytica]|uniref:Peptide/nickel transport system permease protein n=1 Tax=Trujillonella endophytica TaxID=673521 RepID=A0A1H8Q6B3_9ACTN|nr:ABC transporter permease [Trujillella endophytica]SEO49759.1 peptide/nickel transport system permease protein [Trujillella endophytica]
MTAFLTGIRRRARSRPARALRHNRVALVAGGVVLLLALIAVAAPVLAPADPDAQELTARFLSPSGEHWLGTDAFGRDFLSRLMYAMRTSLFAALLAVAVAVVLGLPLGLIAGYAGRWVDAVLSRVAEAIMSMPGLILAIAIVAVLGPGLTNAMIALGVILAPTLFRIARAAALSTRNADYIEAARSVGCSPARILGRHVLPNALSPLIVQLTFHLGAAIIAESSLSFLGLGAQTPTASLGTMVRDGYQAIYETTFPIYPPSVVIAVLILAFTLFGDGLRDAFGGRGER